MAAISHKLWEKREFYILLISFCILYFDILRDTILDNPTILKVRECNAFYSLKKSIITLHLSSYRFTLGENKKGGSMRHKY